MPLAGLGAGEAAGGPIPGEGARRRRGEVGEQHVESESNLGTPLVELGVACGGPATEQWRRRPVADGGGAAPAVRGGGEWVWELHYGEGDLAAGSIWGEEGRRRGLRVELWGGNGHGGGGCDNPGFRD